MDIISPLNVIYLLAIFLLASQVISARKKWRRHKQVHEEIEKGFLFKKKVNSEEIKIYYRRKGVYLSIDFFGTEIWKPCLVDEKGIEVETLTDIEHSISLTPLSSGSHIPSKSYRVIVSDVYMAEDNNTANDRTSQLCISLQPANNDVSVWSVKRVFKKALILEHQLMGSLYLPKHRNLYFEVGQTVSLISKVTEIGNKYFTLTYRIIK